MKTGNLLSIIKCIAWITGIYVVVVCGLFHFLYKRPLAKIQPGSVFISHLEGFEQRVVWIHDEEVCLESRLRPFSPGPPLHVHIGFDEHFTVLEGTLHLQFGDSVLKLFPGQQVTIPRGTAHKPFNPGKDEVVLFNPSKGTVPLSFARGLAWFYPAMDREGSAEAPGNLFHLALLGPEFDTWLAEKPFTIQWFLRWILAPVAWLRQ